MEKPKERAKKPKKPFFIKKADLDLDGYKKEIQDQSPRLLFNRAVNTLRTSRQFHFYVALQLLSAVLGFGQVMLCVGSLPLITLAWFAIVLSVQGGGTTDWLADGSFRSAPLGILWMMIANTGKRKPGEKSAYSLFNDDVEA